MTFPLTSTRPPLPTPADHQRAVASPLDSRTPHHSQPGRYAFTQAALWPALLLITAISLTNPLQASSPNPLAPSPSEQTSHTEAPPNQTSAPNPDETPDQLLEQARTSLAQGDSLQAQDLLARALALSPNSPSANLMLGDLLLSQHHFPEAMDRFETVLSTNLRNSRARDGERTAAVALALQARTSGNQPAALATLRHAHDALPDDPTLLTDLGVQEQSMHLLQPAAKALSSALALDPRNLTALYALARVETDQENFAAAEQHFRAYLAARPNDASAHYGLGRLFQLQLHTDAASAEFQRSIALQPLQTESYFQLGQIALDAHRDTEARALFQKTLARAPTHGGALTGLGILDFRARDYPAARQSLTAAIQAYPEYQPAHYYLGLTLTRLGDKPAATRELALAADLAQKQQGKSQPLPPATLP